MTEISDEELARFKAIEKAGKEVLEHYPVAHGIGVIFNLHKALKLIHTPLMSDAELEAVCHWKDSDHQNHGEGFYNPLRRVGALYLRKMADIIWLKYREQADAVAFAAECTDIIRKWAGEEVGYG